MSQRLRSKLPRRWLDDGIVGMSPTLLGAKVIVGIASGAHEAAYLFAQHALPHVLWPALFALEILRRRGMQYYEALMPAIVGSLSGYACYLLLTGTGVAPVWRIPGVAALRATDLLWAAGAGVLGAAIAVTFTYLTL